MWVFFKKRFAFHIKISILPLLLNNFHYMKKTQKILDILAFIESKDITADEATRLMAEIEWNTYREDEGEEPEDLYDRMEAENGQY